MEATKAGCGGLGGGGVGLIRYTSCQDVACFILMPQLVGYSSVQTALRLCNLNYYEALFCLLLYFSFF